MMFEAELSRLKQERVCRTLTGMDPVDGSHALVNGKSLLLLCSNDYLGLASHPVLREAAAEAMNQFGFGAGASRLVSGTSSIHLALERRIARFKGTEAALLFNSGYAANTGIIPALMEQGDLILSDQLNHASIIDGCRLSRARTEVYRHCDPEHLETLLKNGRQARRRLIVTDGVFSMDGDVAPLRELVLLARKYDALLMVDDAHGTGVLGPTGGGTAEHFGISSGVAIQMGTLSKAFGSFGAYMAGSRELIDILVNRSRSLIFSTALPPAVCAASLAALDLVACHPELRERLWSRRDAFVQGLAAQGIPVGRSVTPILPLVAGSSENAVRLSGLLMENGIYAPAIRPPSVPEGSARIRATVTAAHSPADIDHALAVFGSLRKKGFL
jgi:8-amino-7-oxononanoate synthase